MALDVYVGSLTRYYAGEWENISERAARERGAPFRIAHPGGSVGDDNDLERIQSAIVAWRLALSESLGARLTTALDWDEEPQAPYYTGRPG
jgi:hypothetical protein